MLNFSKEKLEFACENCGRNISIKIEQAAREEKVKCRYCGANIQLKDDGSVKKSLKDIDKSFKDLEKTFKNFGK